MSVKKVFFAGDASANLGVVGATARLAREMGGSATYGQLADTLLVPGVADNEEALRASVRVAVSIGLFESSAASIKRGTTVTPVSEGEENFDTPQLAQTFLNQLALHSVQQIEAGGDVPDLAYGLAWLLHISPDRPFASWSADSPDMRDPEKEIRAVEMGSVIQNSTQWVPFRRWVVSLGFGNLIRAGTTTFLEPDPTMSFRRAFKDRGRLTAKNFISHLSTYLPFVTAGVVGMALRESFPKVMKPEHDLSLVESYAIRRLELEGRLELESHQDASVADRVSVAAFESGQGEVFDKVRVGSRG